MNIEYANSAFSLANNLPLAVRELSNIFVYLAASCTFVWFLARLSVFLQLVTWLKIQEKTSAVGRFKYFSFIYLSTKILRFSTDAICDGNDLSKKKKKKQDLFLTLMKLQEFSVAQRLRSFLSNSRMLQSSTKIISIIFSAAFCKESRLFTVLLFFFLYYCKILCFLAHLPFAN